MLYFQQKGVQYNTLLLKKWDIHENKNENMVKKIVEAQKKNNK
jgi:hypothetical protein